MLFVVEIVCFPFGGAFRGCGRVFWARVYCFVVTVVYLRSRLNPIANVITLSQIPQPQTYRKCHKPIANGVLVGGLVVVLVFA